MAEPLIGPQPIIGPGDSPDVIGGDGPTTEYAPINEAARQAIFGVNPATGKAYTDAASAAANAGYNPYAGAVGYQIDPRTGNLNILKNDGTVMTTGATYQTTSQGAIVPSTAYMQDFNKRLVESGQSPIAFDEYGVQITLNPDGTGIDSKGNPLTVVYDAGGNPKGSPAAFVASNAANQSKSNNNPFVPGSEAAQAWNERKSAYDLLYTQFKQYGLEALIAPLQGLITEGVPASEFTIRLRETEAYKKRFAANAQRIAKGLTAISEAEYLGLEDQYQNIMRNYGLPAEYYTRGDMGTQEGFTKFIANDVSAAELEDRVMTAQSRVMNANPEVLASLKAFYPDITNGDILAYTLDPTKGLTDIKRKVTAAEIGGAATQAGLGITGTRAGELTAAGITKAQAQQGFQTVAEVAPRGGQLAEIYKQSPYTQTTAEQEVFGLAGSAEAARQRKKLTSLETAAFSGSAGVGAIARDRAGVL
jgi:hypothetical protein